MNMKEQNQRTQMTSFKTYDEATVIKTVWYWHKDKRTDNGTLSEQDLGRDIYFKII